jgi:Fur family transcriptional regulator, ferric uptake regulator
MSMQMMDRLRAYIDDNKLKNSKQREKIAEIFFSAGGHLNVEQLLDRVRQHDPHVGQATVYRTMRLLVSSGLAERRPPRSSHLHVVRFHCRVRQQRD